MSYQYLNEHNTRSTLSESKNYSKQNIDNEQII